MKTSDARMPHSNAKSSGSTSDKRLGDAVAPGRCLSTAGDLPADLTNRCPTCLPFVFYTDADGQFLHGTSDSRSVADFLADLNQVAAGGQ